MESSSHQPSAETDSLTERQLVALLEAREAEKEAERRALSRRGTRLLLLGAIIMLVGSVLISFAIEWHRAKNPKPAQQESITSKLHIDQSDVNFGRQLFEYVVPADRKPAAPATPNSH